jgi:hypothetical protein
MVKSYFLIFEMEKQKINPVVSKCYRCRYSLTDAGTTVKIKAVRVSTKNKEKIFIPTNVPATS